MGIYVSDKLGNVVLRLGIGADILSGIAKLGYQDGEVELACFLVVCFAGGIEVLKPIFILKERRGEAIVLSERAFV